jgi:nicotinamidase/pyrazinamidase
MKKLLIVVDYQNDFISGALGFPGAEKLASRIAEKISAYRRAGSDIVFTLDTHGDDYLDTNEGKNLPVRHCIKGTQGYRLHPSIEALVQPGDRIIEKPSFGSQKLFDYLRGSDYDEIELCGLVTDICVVSNAILAKTALPEAVVTVDSSCVGTPDAKKQEAALSILESVQVRVLR